MAGDDLPRLIIDVAHHVLDCHHAIRLAFLRVADWDIHGVLGRPSGHVFILVDEISGKYPFAAIVVDDLSYPLIFSNAKFSYFFALLAQKIRVVWHSGTLADQHR